jgi:Region found in RelA / SpoT proteins
VADAYQAVLDQVELQLGELGFEATTRVKTTGTLLDKLRRDPTLKLRSIHDLAGARIVIDGTLDDQDAAKARVIEAFASCPRPPVEKDRRKTPSHGYRAVHVIVFPENMPVEIQVRTDTQNGWAQFAESLGDMWGRGLRYGTGPDDPDAPAGKPFAEGLTRAQVVDIWVTISDLIYDMERLDLEVSEGRALIAAGTLPGGEVMADIERRVQECHAAVRARLGMLGLSRVSEA